ncbi:pantetheine-phosphate adenylyltransferase family protein [Aspergillus sp. HF37]|nr:pantetheine-phosphate adenylyltransferase family protein [Aspergillus sp. HF37]
MPSDCANPPSALLLFPPPPSADFERFKYAYEPTLSVVYAKLAKAVSGADHMAVLDIALSIPDLLSLSCQSQGRVIPYLQRFLATLYRLIGTICIEENVALDVPGGVDTRVIFVDYDPAQSPSTPKECRPFSQQGPTLDLQSLASSERRWDSVYYMDNKPGQSLATAFNNYSSASLYPLPAVSNWTLSGPGQIPSDDKLHATHCSVAVGGTFDHFHIGHKLLLSAATLALEPIRETGPGSERLLTIGVTVDELLANKKYAECLQDWDERCHSVISFLSAITVFGCPENRAPSIQRVSQPDPNGKYVLVKLGHGLTLKLVPLSDPFGPTVTEEDINTLVVSKETKAGGAAVNAERAKKGWKSLDVFEIDVLSSGNASATDVEKSFESKISSTEIRRRRMNQAKA